MAAMSVVLIVVLVLVVLVFGVSVVLGRTTSEVESARDTEYLELEGVLVRYNVMGGGPAVVLVHGWLTSSRLWEQLAGRLAQRFTVYTLDLSGFGESDKPIAGYGVRNGSRLLYAFCAHFGLTRANVIGHDLGGAMAVKLAADHPDVVGRLVIVSTPADDDQIDVPTMLWLATLPVVGPLFYALGRAARPVRRLWMRPFVADPDDLTEEVVDDAGRSTPAAVSKTLSIGRREISRGRLARQARIIKIPLLVVAGEQDQIVDPQSVGVWAGGVDRAEISLIDECGHLPMIERTAEFNAQILAFLTGDPRYLDYIPPTPATAPTIEQQQSEDTPDGAVPEESPAEAPTPTDDTKDFPSGATDLDRDSAPKVVRKQNGIYPARTRPPRPEGSYPDEAPGTTRPKREPTDDHFLPELPDDLFDWPEPRRED
jgi:pimeloyl-ACP methyl ester carboxylesterase